MTVASWPATLPKNLINMIEKEPDNLIRSTNAVGPEKMRRRTTANTGEMTGTLRLTNDQRLILQTFFRETIKGGALPFYFPDQYGGSDTLVRLKPFETTRVGGSHFDVSLTFSILP